MDANEQDTQYLTLYNKEHGIPVFSVSVSKPSGNNDVEKIKRGGWQVVPEYGNPAAPTDDDYSTDPSISRGYLFPHHYAKGQEQAKAKMKLTNNVPQDSMKINGKLQNLF